MGSLLGGTILLGKSSIEILLHNNKGLIIEIFCNVNCWKEQMILFAHDPFYYYQLNYHNYEPIQTLVECRR